MTTAFIAKLKPYIQPFERRLAIDELTVLAKATPRAIDGDAETAVDFRIDTSVDARLLASRLAYWETVIARTAFTTEQSLRESTVNVVRNGVPLLEIRQKLPFGISVPLPNRRCLRYGPHGIHEYRGKFFPQLVRSLMNVAGVGSKSIVADTMCGSGTTPVEAALMGCRGLGLDMNPLSVEISRTKCLLLNASPEALERAYETVKAKLMSSKPAAGSRAFDYLNSLPERDQQYLRAWFGELVLRDLDQIVQAVEGVKDEAARSLMRISISNILRRVSWQKEDDLRVRKEVRPDVEIDPIREFLEEIGRSIRFVLAFLRQEPLLGVGPYSIQEGDARKADEHLREYVGKVDAIITSPPYATALPYLDTDRLSLCYLQLLERPEHRRRDDQMIGNREVTERGRLAYWALYEGQRKLLPKSVHDLIAKIVELNADGDVGFRRRNLPALLAKYFLDMRLVLTSMLKLLKPGGPAFVVVGNNHTIAGGQRVEIETAQLLADVAEMVGFKQGGHRPMEMLVSRDIFKKNAVASETILELRRSTVAPFLRRIPDGVPAFGAGGRIVR